MVHSWVNRSLKQHASVLDTFVQRQFVRKDDTWYCACVDVITTS